MDDRRSATELIERVQRTLRLVLTLSNVAGAVVVFIFLTLVLPVRHPPPAGEVFRLNGPVFLAFGAAASLLAPRWGRSLYNARLRWIREGRTPSPEEQRRTLRNSLAQLQVTGAIWGLGAVLFSLLNLHFSAEIAGRVAGGVVMGGLVTGAISYLAGERAQRPIIALALEAGVPERPVAPGVVVRTVLAWGLATGVPVIGVTWVAAGVIHGDTPRNNATAWSVIFLAVVALAAGAIGIVAAAKSIAEPVRAVRRALARVEEGDIDVEVTVDDASEVGLLQAGFNRMVQGLRERERIRDLFGRHVGEDVARQALEAGIGLGGEVREAAAVFIDVLGSTSLAARVPPAEVVARLNGFFTLVLEVVHRHGGWVNKFEGDAALCVFGVPTPTSDPAGRALATARELAGRLETESPLEAGVGVSAGEVVAGNVGAAERFEYTVIGDPVNEAARLTELAKDRRPRVLASGRAVERASADEAARWEIREEVRLRGRAEPTQVAAPVESAVPAR